YSSHAPLLFFFTDPRTPHSPPLPLHDALPISPAPAAPPTSPACSGGRSEGMPVEDDKARASRVAPARPCDPAGRLPASAGALSRSEEHTSELQSLTNLVCRLLLEKKKTTQLSTQEGHTDDSSGHLTAYLLQTRQQVSRRALNDQANYTRDNPHQRRDYMHESLRPD